MTTDPYPDLELHAWWTKRARVLLAPARRPIAAPAVAAKLTAARGAQVRAEIARWPGYAPTPLHAPQALADRVGVGRLWVKDETERFGVGSFKALGAGYAVGEIVRCHGGEKKPVFAAASEGNHGYAVAWASKAAGCLCQIYLHEGVSADRAASIAALGAHIVRTPGGYDRSVAQVGQDARNADWRLIADTSDDPDDPTPLLVMAGYTAMLDELAEQLKEDTPTHIFVQAGVGGLAGAVSAYAADRWGRSIRIAVVEAASADCLWRSAAQGRKSSVERGIGTELAGLACGVPSAVAWPILHHLAGAYIAINDEAAEGARIALAEDDALVMTSASGAAGFAGLVEMLAERDAARGFDLDADSRVLVIATERARLVCGRA